MPASASRVLLTLALAGVVATGVTACASESAAAPTTAPTAEAPSATPTPTATDAPAEQPESTPVTIGCDQLISPEAMYAYNANYGLNDSYTPAAGTEAGDIAALDGLACAWVNQTSGAVIEVAVASLPDAALTDLKNRFVTESNSVPTYEVEGYFQMLGTTGQADAFSGPYWISATSSEFFEPGDVQPIMAAAVAGLG